MYVDTRNLPRSWDLNAQTRTIDAASTRAVGAIAKKVFPRIDDPAPPGTPQLPSPEPDLVS